MDDVDRTQRANVWVCLNCGEQSNTLITEKPDRCERCGRRFVTEAGVVIDQITINELVLFLGTGLKCKVVTGETFELKCVQQFGGIWCFVADDEYEATYELQNIQPIVRPLSVRTPDVLLYHTIKSHADNHGDIFGWLDRTGIDGEPLAIEKVEG